MWLIRERLFLGNYASGIAALSGVRRPLNGGPPTPFAGVVSLCPMPLFPEDPMPGPEAEETEWLELPIADGGNGEAEFAAALALAVPFLRRRRETGNVLVHCAAGMSRSVSVVAALLCDQGLEVSAAFREVALAKSRSPGIRVSDPMTLIDPAAEFQRHLRQRFAQLRA